MSLDRLGQWSISKLEMLSEYAHAYSTIMQAQKRTWLKAYYYIDGFAGPGIALYEDDQEVTGFLSGSPVRALACDPKFDHLWFVDRSRARSALLQETINRLGEGERATVRTGDSNIEIQSIVSNLGRQERALAFLDPYGLQVEWSTIRALAESGIVDVFINFSSMGIIRNLRREGGPSDDARAIFRTVLADSSWIDDLYVPQGSLFGDPVAQRGVLATAQVAEHYASDLRGVFK